jgi:SAM-dependent methyltransferase/nicotinamide mononucleotide adenylyltransferase
VIALLVGRFHAVTAGQARWIGALATAPGVDRIVCVVTSADHSGTRRNPLEASVREQMLSPVLAATGKPFQLVRVNDVAESAGWVPHVCAQVQRLTGTALTPATTRVYTSNREVDALFAAQGFTGVSSEVQGPTPHELVQRIVQGKPWQADAAAPTLEVYSRREVLERLKAIYAQRLLNDDGELGHHRDFASYGEQMDAALKQKLEDLLPWVRPGKIVDKGCGTGKLLVELSRLYPDSALVGVDLSREFLRRCDENHYAAQDVDFVFGNIVEPQVAPGTATTVVFSSVVHEVCSYSDYALAPVHQALESAAAELQAGGHVLVRDGVSPGTAPWRLRFLNAATRDQFARFAAEFKHGQGAPHEVLGPDEVRLSAHLANEFLCKKDYLKNWHIEVHEEYGTFTPQGWREALDRAGFDAVEVRAYVNSWIAEHRYRGTAQLRDDAGGALGWPSTNVVVVGRRRAG